MKEEIERTYWSNGQLWYEIPLKNGKKHGLANGWYENRQLKYEIPFKNDLQCGARIYFEY